MDTGDTSGTLGHVPPTPTPRGLELLDDAGLGVDASANHRVVAGAVTSSPVHELQAACTVPALNRC